MSRNSGPPASIGHWQLLCNFC